MIPRKGIREKALAMFFMPIPPCKSSRSGGAGGDISITLPSSFQDQWLCVLPSQAVCLFDTYTNCLNNSQYQL